MTRLQSYLPPACATLAFVVASIAAVPAPEHVRSLAGPSAKSVWDSVYTVEQAARADTVYSRACVKCHGPEYTGTVDGPPLTGPDFLADWNGSTVGDLYSQILGTMPRGESQSVSAAAKLDLIALLLRENKFPAGKTELANDSLALKQIKIEPGRP
jgi:mono/diheme cytochrome c family protein